MECSEEIVLEIIKELYPEWIKREREKYRALSEYEQFVMILKTNFFYDIKRACGERDHGMDYTELERKLNIIKLNSQLQTVTEKNKEKKNEMGKSYP